LSAIEFAAYVSKAVGLELPSTILFDYPSLPSMSDHIYDLISPLSANAEILHSFINNISEQRPLATISISGRLPPCCDANMLGGSECIALVPYSRWDLGLQKVSMKTGTVGSCRWDFRA
jgi:hypothetical protein